MRVGDALPLFDQFGDYMEGLFVKAYVQDPSGNPITGSPVVMADIGSGGYRNTTLLMPNVPWVWAQYLVYTDGTYTTLSNLEGGNDQIFERSDSNIFPQSSNVTGVVEGEGCAPFPIQDVVVQGSDRTIMVRLILNALGDPLDISDATLLEFRFRNTDGTVLSLKSTDIGNPVQIVSGAAGKLLCTLTAVQTALLKVQSPSPFTIKVTLPSGVIAINLPTQLAVDEQEV